MTTSEAQGRPSDVTKPSVVIVGGGFAGVACAVKLAKRGDVDVTLIDRNPYHQFQPLLYQVATYQLAKADIAYPLAEVSQHHGGLPIVEADVVAVDPIAKTVTTADGRTFVGDFLVIAAGSQAFFFKTPGASEHSIPLYSLDDALRLRRRILAVFDDAAADASVLDEGALEFVVVGGGPTGVEVSGAIVQMIATTMRQAFPAGVVGRAHVTLVDHGETLLKAFAASSGTYAAETLGRDGVALRLGVGVAEVGPGHVALSDGSRIAHALRDLGWRAPGGPGRRRRRAATGSRRPDRRPAGPDGRRASQAFTRSATSPTSPRPTATAIPQLGSVAQQSGRVGREEHPGDSTASRRQPFKYLDKGIMAMIGRGAAVAEVGDHHAPARHDRVRRLARRPLGADVGVPQPASTPSPTGPGTTSDRTARRPLDRTDTPVIDWGEDAETVGRASRSPVPSA